MKKKIFILFITTLFFVTNIQYVDAATISAEDLVVDGKTCYKHFHNNLNNKDNYWTDPSEFINVDDKTAYCIDFGVHLNTGTADFEESYLTELNNNHALYKKISLIGLFGYDYPGHNTKNYYAAAQLLIWQELSDAGIYSDYQVSDMNFYTGNSGYKTGELVSVDKEKAEIKKLVDDYSKTPSFCNKNYTVKKGNELILTDENQVLSNYDIDNKDNDYISYNVKDNKITLEGLEVGKNITFNLSKGFGDDVTFVYSVDDGQKVIVPTDYPEIACEFTVEVTEEDAGYIQIKKTDKENNEPLEGVKFSIYNSNDDLVDTVITDENGIALSQKLPYGEYYILEVESLDGYIINEEKIEVKIDKNDIFEIELTNEKEIIEQVPTGDILIGIVWAIGVFCLGLSIHYYTEVRKNKNKL